MIGTQKVSVYRHLIGVLRNMLVDYTVDRGLFGRRSECYESYCCISELVVMLHLPFVF